TLGTGTLTSGSTTCPTATRTDVCPSNPAEYSNDGNFNASTSAVLTQTVNKADTTTTLSSSANPSVYGQSVTFTATVAATAPGAEIGRASCRDRDGVAGVGAGTVDDGGGT